LSRRFKFEQGVGNSTMAPLSFSKQLARSGGGTWVVLAAKPLEDVKLPTNEAGMRAGLPPAATVQETLEALTKAGTPVAWDTTKGYMLLDYAPPHDIDRIRAAPPVETVGVLLCAENVPDLLKAVGDVWRVQVDAAPDLISRIDAYNAAHRAVEKDAGVAVAEWTEQAYSAYGRYGQVTEATDQAEPESRMVEFHALKRLDFGGLINGLARTLGGQARDLGGDKWRIEVIADPAKQQAEILKLKTIVDESVNNSAAGFTSFAQRSGAESGGDSDSETVEQPVPIPEVSEDAAAAFQCLGSYGAAAVPTLVSYLDPEKPQAAKPAAETLAAINTADAHGALIALISKLRAPSKDKAANAMRPELLDLMIRLVSRYASSDVRDTLATIALDEKAEPDVRRSARMAIVAHGDIAAFSAPSAKQLSGGEMEHVVRYPPEPGRPEPMQTAADPGTIVPLATTRTQQGDVWAVFVSGRFGNTNDLWLAHGKDHQWSEFLFTGKQFTRQNGYNGYGNGGGPTKGACALAVNGDTVLIKPPDVNLTAEVARLMKLLQDPKMPPERRNTLSNQYQRAAQKAANLLDKTISLSLIDLHKDSDGDGLPDIVEKRLGLDPHKADTDGDGLKDGVDSNPLAGPESTATDRGKILQMIFTALYGKDMSPDPILVVLDRKDWQEFYGARARVICITHHDLIANALQLGTLRILQFGGPNDANATILKKDGPVLFNDEHTRAEVHFWQWKGSNSADARVSLRRQYGQPAESPREFIAQFDNKPAWKMTSFKPNKADTADKAATELSAVMAAGQYGRVY
jgi:hypothetical protein